MSSADVIESRYQDEYTDPAVLPDAGDEDQAALDFALADVYQEAAELSEVVDEGPDVFSNQELYEASRPNSSDPGPRLSQSFMKGRLAGHQYNASEPDASKRQAYSQKLRNMTLDCLFVSGFLAALRF